MTKRLSLDETGNGSMKNLYNDDSQRYPIFGVGGTVMDENYAQNILPKPVNDFKIDAIGKTNFILHTSDIVRDRKEFHILRDANTKAKFYEKINSLMSNLEYEVLACITNKIKLADFLTRHKVTPPNDLYNPFTSITIDRYMQILLRDNEQGTIVAESRGNFFDKQLMTHWQTIKENGTTNFTAKEINERITSFTLHTKKNNIASLEIADLIINPIGTYVLNGLEKPDWKIVKSKIPTHGKFWLEAGIIQLPENIISLHDIFPTIE